VAVCVQWRMLWRMPLLKAPGCECTLLEGVGLTSELVKACAAAVHAVMHAEPVLLAIVLRGGCCLHYQV